MNEGDLSRHSNLGEGQLEGGQNEAGLGVNEGPSNFHNRSISITSHIQFQDDEQLSPFTNDVQARSIEQQIHRFNQMCSQTFACKRTASPDNQPGKKCGLNVQNLFHAMKRPSDRQESSS